jgi:undecaprenyl-diphosphatase
MSHPRDKGSADGGSPAEHRQRTGAGPLSKVEPVNTAAPGTDPRQPSGLATLTVVVGFAALVAILVVLGSVAEGVRTQEVFALDTWATPFLHGIASPGLDALMNALTDTASNLVVIPIFGVVVILLLSKRRYRFALFLGVAIGGSLLLQATMKVFFARLRPQLPWAQVLPDGSFPSGHTMNAVIFYGALALILWSLFGRRIGLLAVAVAAAVAFGVSVSRIYLGYHYFTDVVGGILAGIAWLLVVAGAFRARPTWRRWRSAGSSRTETADGPGDRVGR